MLGFDIIHILLGAVALLVLGKLIAFLVRRVSRSGGQVDIPVGNMSETDLANAAVDIGEQAREAIMWARSSDRSAKEGNDRPSSGTPEDVPIKVKRNTIYATISRIKQHDDIFRRLDEIRNQFRFMFGNQAARPLDIIADSKNRVIVHTEMLLNLDISVGGNPHKENDKRRPLEVTIGFRTRDDGIDPIEQKLDEALIPLKALAKSLR